MVDVEDHHLRGAAGLAAGLDRARPRVGAAHERHGPGSSAALRKRLDRSADLRQIHAGAGAAAEDAPFAGVPVENRLHGVVDGQDEAGRALRLLFEADVEPDRRVESGELVQQDVRELVAERVGVEVVGQVALLDAPVGDGAGDAADHLANRVLARGRVELAAEVLLSDDVGGVLRPSRRELDVVLQEHGLVGVADQRGSDVPVDGIEDVDAGRGEVPAQRQSRSSGVSHGRAVLCMEWMI